MKTTLVFVPGAWTGAWGWQPLMTFLPSSAFAVHTLTLSGLAKEADVSAVGLSTHVDDVAAFIESRNLSDVVLVGHSYSGIVIGLVAQKLRERVKQLIFIEAFLPTPGQSLLESAELDVEAEKAATKANGGRWPAPTRAELEGQSFLTNKQKDWLSDHFVGHPGQTVKDKVPTDFSMSGIEATYIGKELPGRRGEQFKHLAFAQLEGGHWPMVTRPEKLAELLTDIAL